MALNEFVVNGKTFQFAEGEQPPGAIPVELKAVAAPANKARSSRNK